MRYLCILAAAALANSAPPTVAWGTYELKLSETGPGNVLPSFQFMEGAVEGGSNVVPIGGGLPRKKPFVPGDDCGLDIWDHASPDLSAPTLPYLNQDQWTCARTRSNVSSIIYEDATLRLSIMPQWGGRIWSVFDKARGRDWTFANPAHQPANIAILKAWTSGGIEFNYSPGIIGHSVFTESPVWVGRLDTARGPVLRVWEYDRRNASVWQVDIFLSGGALWLHPKLTNTLPATPLQGYWWTCVAVPAKPTTRVVTAAAWVAETSAQLQCPPWPHFSMGDGNASFTGRNGARLTDNSWLGAASGGDFFMGTQPAGQHGISYSEPSGFTAFHGHPAGINGSKFFTWGQNGGGRFMQDFLGGLSGPDAVPDAARAGDYAELQVGPAFTQMQTFDLPVAAPLQWTEYFSAFDGAPGVMMGDDYTAATDAVAAWRASPASGVNDTAIADVNAFLTALADTPVTAVLAEGSPWGAVELARRASPGGGGGGALFPHGVHFNASDADADAAPWLELVSAAGTFSAATLALEPTSYQVAPEWLQALNASAAAHGATWLHHLHTGVALAEAGGVAEPAAHFSASLLARPSAVVARCLAVLQSDAEAAWAYFDQAWGIAVAADAAREPARDRLLTNLATEVALFLQGQGQGEAWLLRLESFLAALPAAGVPALLRLDAVLVSRVIVAIARGDNDAAVALLADRSEAGCFPTYGSARGQLMVLWVQAQVAKAQAAAGRPLTQWEQRNVRVDAPVPRNIGCPFGAGSGYPDCSYW